MTASTSDPEQSDRNGEPSSDHPLSDIVDRMADTAQGRRVTVVSSKSPPGLAMARK